MGTGDLGVTGVAPLAPRVRPGPPDPDVPAPSPRRHYQLEGTAALVAGVVTAVAVAVGVALQLWYLFNRPTTSDEAIAGLMANQILHGHFSAFYWGQSYGGVEPYLIAARLGLLGNSTFLLTVVASLLSVLSGLVVWRIALRLVPDRRLAALAAALAWVAPEAMTFNATYEYGFRGVTMLCGLLLLLLSLRRLDGDARTRGFVALGLVAGIGWWSSPEIVFFGVPSLLIILGALARDWQSHELGRWIGHLLIALVAAVVGALPWLWTNFHTNFASIRTSTFVVPAGSPHYGGRVRVFFHDSLPLLFSLRGSSGAWLFRSDLAKVVLIGLLALLGAALVLCLLSTWRHRAVAIAVVLFPFLVTISPATWYFRDGRYVMYVVPLIAFTFMIGCSEAARRWQARRRVLEQTGVLVTRLAFSALVLLLMAFSLANFNTFEHRLSQFTSGWGNPDGPTVQALPAFERQGIRDGYADYWVAYRLDYLSAGRLHLTVAGLDPDRWTAQNRSVLRSASTAWVFPVPTKTAQRQFNGTAALGPGGISYATFVHDLGQMHIGYKVVTSGFLRAIVPDTTVTPAQLGLG